MRVMQRVSVIAAAIAGLLSVPALHAAGPAPVTPLRATDLWLAPATISVDKTPLSTAVEQVTSGRSAAALPALSRAVSDPALGPYALLYQGRAHFQLGRMTDAASDVRQLLALHPKGHLAEAALMLNADIAENTGQSTVAIQSLQALLMAKMESPAELYLRLGRLALAAKEPIIAADAFTKAYYDYPLSDESAIAASELLKMAPKGTPT